MDDIKSRNGDRPIIKRMQWVIGILIALLLSIGGIAIGQSSGNIGEVKKNVVRHDKEISEVCTRVTKTEKDIEYFKQATENNHAILVRIEKAINKK